jgi:hypothetical protein
MLKNFRISSPNRRLDPHFAQSYLGGYVEIFPHNIHIIHSSASLTEAVHCIKYN